MTDIAGLIVRDVAELPDRDSVSDLMEVTAEELDRIVRRHVEELDTIVRRHVEALARAANAADQLFKAGRLTDERIDAVRDAFGDIGLEGTSLSRLYKCQRGLRDAIRQMDRALRLEGQP